MNNELIERIDYEVESWEHCSKSELLRDCKAEIERLLLANETLKELNVEYLERVKALEAKTVGEPVSWMQIDINDKPTNLFFNSVPADDYHTYIPLYTAPLSIDALIAEIDDWLSPIRHEELHRILDKYRSKK